MAEEAVAKAKAIAARLSGVVSGSELGKRKNRWDDDANGPAGLGAIQKKKVYIPTNSDTNFLGLLIGPRGATQKQMQEATGAKIVFRGIGASKDGGPSNTGHEDDTDKLHVSIEGPPDAVERALHQVEQILYNPAEASRLKAEQLKNLAGINNVMSVVENIYGPGGGSGDQTSVEIRIPNNMVGLVIGKGGESILRIQSQLGVNAQIDKECPPGENYRRIVLKGKPSAVDEARARIDDIINARVSMGGNSSNNHKEMDYAFVVRLPVPNDKVGIIIGKGGMTVKGIQERCYVNVQIPAGPDDDNPQVRTLSIGADTKEAVDAAQMEIFMTLQQQQQSALQAYNSSGSITNVVVPDDKVGLIIGKGGLTVKDIQNRYQVKIQIPQVADAGSYPPVRTLSIAGPPENHAGAKYEVEMIAKGTPVNPSPSSASSSQYGGGDMWGGATSQMYGMGSYYGGATAGAYAGTAAYGQSYGGYYGATASDPYSMQQAAYGQTGSTDQQSTETAVPTDPTAYYDDYWKYASYYGEAAARIYYGAWSPPEGTPPPPGTVLPAASDDQANGASVVPSNGQASLTAGIDNAQQDKSGEKAKDDKNGSSEEVDAEAAAAAWEKYKREYAEWYEAHGKAAGADPNPPMASYPELLASSRSTFV